MKTWKTIIEENREELAVKVSEAWKSQLTVDTSNSNQEVVILWNDGDITTGYRGQNSFSTGEHNGTAICIASFGGQKDESYNEYKDTDDYISDMVSNNPVDADSIIDEAIRDYGDQEVNNLLGE